ncbi:tRNA cyclic N6-threonylcarbamoyladenosine(37) synthase TcdA [Candidatus Erwinia haradaeae]|uniref:tRNA threonylcarbamoyladenosine dehydratase n=1 Tax=Candidatus Erwinia haradaeae TaxID=1922217 RepID=A0A803FST4_9GAMM|nr:tRNA cyclic N6-threonylcarbamoyladenosine(37) synthase TcdA [Candidatus Erwinia haradaeae]VFP87106.1 tRNA threonylcarbamoyladenosine dehydratase [Candidatus Erwinia haradaeae]
MKTLSLSWKERFSGVSRVYGEAALSLFSKKHICVIGIGGVGSWVAEALARSGIGMLTLIDMDDVCISNTNRQIHATKKNLGKPKIQVMAERILEINPECDVTYVDDFITVSNAPMLLDNNFSYVIDAIDSVTAKAALLAWCRRNNTPVITIGGAGGQIDPLQIQVSDLTKTIQDPLAASLRDQLKHNFNILPNSKGKLNIDCVFSSECLRYLQKDGSISNSRGNMKNQKTIDCKNGLGTVMMVTATFGLISVSHIFKKMLYNA